MRRTKKTKKKMKQTIKIRKFRKYRNKIKEVGVERPYKTFMFPDCPELIKARDLKEANKIYKNLRKK